MTYKNVVDTEIEHFYTQYPTLSHRNDVQYAISDDVFSARMGLVQTDRDKANTLQQKNFLQQVNGNVVWGKTNTDPITVILSAKVFHLDEYTWLGTVHHEYTHAHDFWNLADYLGINEMDDIYDYKFYNPFYWWSEYHARKRGTTNVYRQAYAGCSNSEIDKNCSTLHQMICTGLIQSTSAYEAMQWYGRYSALKELYGAKMLPLQVGHKKYGLPTSRIDIGRFLHSHQDFNSICSKFDEFERLINKV